MKGIITFFFLTVVLFALADTALAQKCKNNPASNDESPKCAGHIIHTINLGEIRELKGKVFYSNGEIPKKVVLELYKVPRDEKDIDPYYFVKGKRTFKTFVTEENGGFCFNFLPEGKYVLKVGVSEYQGMECQHILVVINKKLKINKELIEIYIPLAI